MALMSSQRFDFINTSSLESRRCSYDVFLSFRGEDVRDNFLEYLYRALRQKGILTFKDDDRLREGKSIKNGILEAIEESRFSIVVLSKNYANSSWCLDELVHILQCNKTMNHDVYPIFYHVEPSQIRHIGGEFGKGFAESASKNKNKVQKWTEVLEEVANLKGRAYPSSGFKTEACLIDIVVREIFSKSIETYRTSGEGLVGIRSRMVEVIGLLDLGSDESRVVGLWGMGGIGKTTLAEAVYKAISWQFDGCSFIEDVAEISNRSGVSALQEHLISDILIEPDLKVRRAVFGKGIIESRMRNKKVLIILDNVKEAKQVESLARLHWFKRGSRIIITSRDEQVLRVCGARVQDILNVQELNEDEAIELFKSKAFEENGETEEFRRLIKDAVQYAKGVPLALKVLGSSLLDGIAVHWESALDKLRESPGDEVQQVLRSSYDGLHWTEKEIFLDIACFFIHSYKYRIIKLLDGCGFNAVSGIDVLVKKSLLTISSDNKLRMHDLVQKMGWSIVHEESRIEPGERSRLWCFDDVKHVLMQNTGTKEVQCIYFNAENLQPRPVAFAKMTRLRFLLQRLRLLAWNGYPFKHMPSTFQPKPDAFAKMTGLRYLFIIDLFCAIDLPNNLRSLVWAGYPLKSMPSTFQPENLVELRLADSRIERLWDGIMMLPMLYKLTLQNSASLTKCPDLMGFPNLEELSLEGCTALVDLHPSVIILKRLRILYLKGCSSLQNLPFGIESQCLQILNFSGCLKLSNILERFGDLKCLTQLGLDETSITRLPQSIGKATNLVRLSLYGCSNLIELPEELGRLDSLEFLDVSLSGVRKLPTSVKRLRNLQTLGCYGCKSIASLSFSGFECLITLNLGDCFLKYIPESISSCMSLKKLYLHGNDFEVLPASIKNLSNLEDLILNSCKSLQELPDLPSRIEIVEAGGCECLETICCPTVYRHARFFLFAGCPMLLGSREISILMGRKFLYNQIKTNKCRSYAYLAYSSPGCRIPEWTFYQNVGGSVLLDLPIQDMKASNLLGFAISAVVATKGRTCGIGVHIGTGGIFFGFGDYFKFSSDKENRINIFYRIDELILDEFDMGATGLEVCFVAVESATDSRFYKTDKALELAPEVKKCGVRLIYKEEIGSISSGEIDESSSDGNEVRGGSSFKRVSTRFVSRPLVFDKQFSNINFRVGTRNLPRRRPYEESWLRP